MCSDEMRLHSRLLATLLNPKANHGLGNEFLKLFLIALGLPEDYITYCKEQIVERTIGEVTETTGGRIDIILEDRGHAVIIENKIYASDQPNQLLRYYNYGVKTFGENNFKLVYLTLYGNEPSPDSLGGEDFEFIKLSYAQDVLKLLKKIMKSKPKKPVHRTIKDYITIIKQLTDQDMDTEYQQSIINEAIDEKYIDATLELLQLTKQIGDALIEKYIIKKLIGFERHKDDILHYLLFFHHFIETVGLIGMDFNDFRRFARTATYITSGTALSLDQSIYPISYSNNNIRTVMLGLELQSLEADKERRIWMC